MAVSLHYPTLGQVTNNAIPRGYCHDLVLTVHANGVITPNTIVLGNKGDVNIARLNFDVSELIAQHILDPLAEYASDLVVYDTSKPRSDDNPKTYIVDAPDWAVPEELLQQKASYQCLYILTERGGTHTTTDQEKWVSMEFTATVNDTLWGEAIEQALESPIIYVDDYGYLVKVPILITPTPDHYAITVTDSELGNKKDVFVKRFELLEQGLDEGFVHHYGVFITDSTIYAVLFKNFGTRYGCLIPKEITNVACEVDFLLIATSITEEEGADSPDYSDDGFKRWVGNALHFTVLDNFLSDETPSYESNFLLSDGSVLLTRQRAVFTIPEEEEEQGGGGDNTQPEENNGTSDNDESNENTDENTSNTTEESNEQEDQTT